MTVEDALPMPVGSNFTTAPAIQTLEAETGSQIEQRIRGFDGMRGVAALGIVIHHVIGTFYFTHAGYVQVPPPWAPNGSLFVDLFFVLSGYLVTTVSMRQLTSRPSWVVRFYGRRAARILPALAVLTACHAIYVWLSGLSMRAEVKNLLPYLTFTINWVYLTPFKFEGISGFEPLWSLAVEWQFYMIAPILMIGLSPFRRRWQLVAVLACVASVAVWRTQQFYAGTAGIALYVRTDFRIDSLLIGMAIAIGMPWIMRQSKPVLAAVGWAGAAGFTAYVANTGLQPDHLNTIGFTVVAVCAAGMVMAIATGVGPATIFSNPVLQVVGRASYSLYIWHMFVMVAVVRALPDLPRSTQAFVALIAVGLVTAASWRFVEKPAMSYFSHRRRARRGI